MRKWSSTPRRVRVSTKADPSQSQTFASVSAAARATGIGRTNIHAMLSGRSGIYSKFIVEYEK